MQSGKLPLEQLTRILNNISNSDPRVSLGPTPGEDAALIDMGEKYLVATTDPITFATNRIGWYAVQVNANDIAVMGGTPRWMMATVLLPEKTSEVEVDSIFAQMNDACRAIGVTLIGGHTEVTYNLPRPIITGVMLGEVDKGKEIRSSGAREGDSIIMTKTIALEGCAILAAEAEDQLLKAGISDHHVQAGKRLLDNIGISIIKDAEITLKSGKITAMHDPTEGGIAGGLRELAEASNLGMHIDQNRIEVNSLTRRYCEALMLNPLGLLASGTLLVCVDPKDEASVIEGLHIEGISSHVIGELREHSYGVKINCLGSIKDLPSFGRDEIVRFLSTRDTFTE